MIASLPHTFHIGHLQHQSEAMAMHPFVAINMGLFTYLTNLTLTATRNKLVQQHTLVITILGTVNLLGLPLISPKINYHSTVLMLS